MQIGLARQRLYNENPNRSQ